MSPLFILTFVNLGADDLVITRIDPPERAFFEKKAMCLGIPIKAPGVVEDAAIQEAGRRLKMVLANLPKANANLIKAGAELHIIGRNQGTSDLPEFRHLKGKPFQGKPTEKVTTIDERTRGMGGLQWSCGEENLLKLANDRYFGRDICVHEFAHTLMNYGLSKAMRQTIGATMKTAIAVGRWKGAYASSDSNEYFAELTMWYFGTHGDTPRGSDVPKPGRDALKNYDPDGYKLLDDLYSGRNQGVDG